MEKLSNEKRLEILVAAISLFSERGFDRTTVDEIAAQANVGKGTIYLYFENKERIFLAIIENGMLESQRIVIEILAQSQPFLDQLHEIIRANLKFIEDNRDFYRIFMKERMNARFNHDNQTRERFAMLHRQTHKTLADFLQTGIQQGFLHNGNAMDFAVALLGIMGHFGMYWLLEGDTDPLLDKSQIVLDIFLNGVKKVV